MGVEGLISMLTAHNLRTGAHEAPAITRTQAWLSVLQLISPELVRV